MYNKKNWIKMAAVTLCQKSLDIHDVDVSKVRILEHNGSVFHLTCDMIWLIWYDMIWYDIWYDMMIYDMIWWYMIWYMIWYDMIWYDMIWYMIWYDMIWYDMIYI
jgi:hypothetical protein